VENQANLSQYFAEMLKLAQQVKQRSYSPYSRFSVGACLRANNNKLYIGTNVENASYGLTLCAEANAVTAMLADGATQIEEIVITGSTSHFCSPCGACRQRLREFAKGKVLVHMCDDKGHPQTMTLEQLLPESFGPEHLGK
jgi:cytidine deaminase